MHFGVCLEDASQCMLVVIGATAEGKKELLAIVDGYRESEASWKEVLLDLKTRGLKIDPSWPSVMARWVSGRHCRRYLAIRRVSVAGCTKRPMC